MSFKQTKYDEKQNKKIYFFNIWLQLSAVSEVHLRPAQGSRSSHSSSAKEFCVFKYSSDARTASSLPGKNGCPSPEHFQDCPAPPNPENALSLTVTSPRFEDFTPCLTPKNFLLPRPAPKQKKASPCIPEFGVPLRPSQCSQVSHSSCAKEFCVCKYRGSTSMKRFANTKDTNVEVTMPSLHCLTCSSSQPNQGRRWMPRLWILLFVECSLYLSCGLYSW